MKTKLLSVCFLGVVLFLAASPGLFGQSGSNTLFVEAEDFNFSEDGVTGGLHANFGDPDCSLLGKGGVFGVDYFDLNANEQPEYRAPTGVGTRLSTGDYTRGDHTVTCDYIVGWNDVGDWYNYTRDFGAPVRYNVYARIASGGASMNAQLARIISDPTQPNQSTEVLGTFAAPPTGGWDLFQDVPLRDGMSNLASVRLSGLTTLRFTILPGNLDFNYLAFVRADPQELPVRVTSVDPPANSDYARAPRIKAVVTDGDSVQVVATSIRLVFDGADVTASSTIVDTESGAEVSYQAPEGSPIGTVHTVRVEWTDNSPTPRQDSFTWNYTEGIYNPEKNLFIESEDFDTGSGQAIPSFGEIPFNAKGLYNGLGATTGIDFNDAGNPEADEYRFGEVPNVGMIPVNDFFPGSARPRPGFGLVPDYKIGWLFPEDWYNYTRNYGGGGLYEIYLRASCGDFSGEFSCRLDLIDDPVSPTPLVTSLGKFRGGFTGGWDVFAFTPLRNVDGEIARVRLEGVRTLRFTSEGNPADLNYLMLRPLDEPLTLTGAVSQKSHG